MPMNGSIHFTGSLGLENEDAVFRALGEVVGARARRYPDGETGPRHYWIRWVFALFDAHPQLARVGGNEAPGDFQGQTVVPLFGLAEGVAGADLDFETLGYARAAIASWERFAALRAEGAIPPGTRFQVSLPTAVALSTTFMEIGQRPHIEPAVERGLARDVAAICAAVPADSLAIQWDVCHEIIAHDGASGRWTLHYDDLLEGSLERIRRQLGHVPAEVEAGIHLCYGDPGHRHVVEPEDFSTCVAFANGICVGAPRPVHWIHMPVPRGRTDDAYFAPLRNLELGPETELYLGLVHYTDGVEGTRRRIAAAERHAAEFGIAAECGFGRRPAETVPELLRIHAAAADG